MFLLNYCFYEGDSDCEMSVIDVKVLRVLGVRPTGIRVPIPLYMRTRLEKFNTGGVSVSRPVQQELSYQHLAALLLEIPDFYQFRRCVHVLVGEKKKKKELTFSI